MDIQVGDKVTYENIEGKIITTVVINVADMEYMINSLKIKIIKIERPEYKLIEEKKELLTEEEKEFLKSYIKFIRLENEIEYIEKTKNGIIVLWFSNSGNYKFEIDRYENFIGIQTDKRYTLKELGLK